MSLFLKNQNKVKFLNKAFFIFILSFIINLNFATANIYFDVRHALTQYNSTRDAVLNILRQYDPKEHIFVGIGKSPTPIIGMMQAMDDSIDAINVPLSNIRGFAPGGLNRLKLPQAYNLALINRLRIHFDHFLPQNITEKKIIVIDFADYGLSLDRAVFEIRKYYAARFPSRVIRVIGLGIVHKKNTEKFLQLQHHHSIRVSEELTEAMIYRRYKNLHQYEDFDLTKISLQKPYVKPQVRTKIGASLKSETYQDLVQAYHDRLKSDEYAMQTLDTLKLIKKTSLISKMVRTLAKLNLCNFHLQH